MKITLFKSLRKARAAEAERQRLEGVNAMMQRITDSARTWHQISADMGTPAFLLHVLGVLEASPDMDGEMLEVLANRIGRMAHAKNREDV